AEPAARGFENRLEISEDLLGLLLDRLADDVAARRERELAGDEHEVAAADGLRIRRALERRGRLVGADGGLGGHQGAGSIGVGRPWRTSITSAASSVRSSR